MNTLNDGIGESQDRSPKLTDRRQPDLAAAEETETTEIETTETRADERLAALFPQEVANDYRSRWDVVQRGFVDDPRQAVHQGDELVAQVLKNLSESFSNEHATLEGRLSKADQASTETLRVALRRYRSFFERLLAV